MNNQNENKYPCGIIMCGNVNKKINIFEKILYHDEINTKKYEYIINNIIKKE